MQNRAKTITFSPLQGNRSKELLDNPDRGFRLEVALDVGLRINPFNKGFNGISPYLHYQYDYYKEDKPKLVQTYFYLSQYEDRDLDATAFESMQTFLDEMHKMKLKAVLRFAYETDFKGPDGAQTERILIHMEQLAPFLEKNKEIIHVFQAGFIGAWGEWHASKYDLDMKVVMNGILDMVPGEIQIQARLPIYKNLISQDNCNYKRIGFHDDFIVIMPHEWDGGLDPSTEQYRQIISQSPALLVDGELPWGTWSENGGWYIDGYEAIKRFAEHRYTSLSLVHNYRENGDEKKYSMQIWKEQGITKEWLDENGLHYSKGWFYNNLGEKINRSVFEYIRDHLGYNIEAVKLELKENKTEKEAVNISLKIRNNGFAAPLGLMDSKFVLVNGKGEITHHIPAGNPNTWHSYNYPCLGIHGRDHKVEAYINTVGISKPCFIGLCLRNYAGQAVRLANDIRFENGINYFCEI